MRIFFARHGQSEANLLKVFSNRVLGWAGACVSPPRHPTFSVSAGSGARAASRAAITRRR